MRTQKVPSYKNRDSAPGDLDPTHNDANDVGDGRDDDRTYA